MDNTDLLSRYNYDSFIPENFVPWERFDESPPAGTTGLDFPLWDLDENQTNLSAIWKANLYTVVEFGSFT